MILARRFRTSPRQIIALISVLSGYIPLMILLMIFILPIMSTLSDRITVLFYCLITYTGIAYFYFHLFNTSETSRRIKLLYQIYRAGSLPEGAIVRLYNITDIVKLRLSRLLETRQLRYENGYYSIDGKILYFAALIVFFWQRILGIKKNKDYDVTE